MYDYIIIGAGPAGIQVAYQLQKNNANYLVLEAGNNAGTSFKTYPRHRTLISINKKHTGSDNAEFNLRHDWNSLISEENFPLFTSYDDNFFPNADNLLTYLNDFINDHQLNVTFGQRVKTIDRNDKGFNITNSDNKQLSCKRLIISTGVPKPFIPDIKGIELVEQYENVSIEQSDFTNKRVLIIGKGNSAFETADHLIPAANLIHVCSPNPLTMAWKSHYVGDLRAVNNNLLDTYQLKSQNAVLDAQIKLIEANNDGFNVKFGYTHANDESEVIYYDRIICCTGFRMDQSLFTDTSKPKMTIDDRFPQLNHYFESINVKDMFFAGTLTQSINYRKTTSGFIHGFRYNSIALVNMLINKYHNKPLPSQRIAQNSESLTSAILARVNVTSALWQQHGFIVDAITIDEINEDNTANYYQQLPRKFCHEMFRNSSMYLLIALDFGDGIEGDPFNQTRIHKDNSHEANSSKFLHPIIYLCKGGKEIAEHHIIEDLEADWTDETVHALPLQRFIEQHLISNLTPYLTV
jgi:thioredoxin reductase